MTNTETMIKALRVLSGDIQSGDGVANVCVADAANMIENMSTQLAKANERVRELEKELANKELLHVGFTNGDQIKNGVVEEGSFYPSTKGCCYIPIYMLKIHEHRIETTRIEQLRKE